MIRSRRRVRHPLDRADGLEGGFVPRWSPAQLGLRALYDYRNSTSTTMVDQSGNGRADATVGGGGNSPLWLPYTIPSVYMPASTLNGVWTAGNVSTPTGDLDIRFSLSDMPSGNINNIIVKDDQSTQRDFYVAYVHTSTEFQFVWWEAGGTIRVVSSGAGSVLPTATGTEYRVTLDVDNGAGASTVTFQRRPIGDGAWTTILSTSPIAPSTVRNSPIPVALWSGRSITSISAANNPARLHSASVRNGIDGPVVCAFDAALCSQTGHTDAQGNVWLVSRSTSGRKTVVQSPTANSAHGVWLYGTDDKHDGPVGAISPATNAASASAFCAFRLHATQASPKVLFSTRTGSGAGATLRIASATTIVADVSDGTTTNTTPAVTFTPGQMVVAGVFLDAAGTAFVRVNGTTGSTVARPSNTQTGGTLTIGADSTPANFIDAGGICPYASADFLMSSAQWAQVVAFYRGGQ